MGMTFDKAQCPCPWCRVHLDIGPTCEDFQRRGIFTDSYPCDHFRCESCRRLHPDDCWACQPVPNWTKEDALRWATTRYLSPRNIEQAATSDADFAFVVSYLVSGGGGGCGPHSPWYELRGHKLSIWPPYQTPKYRERGEAETPAPFVFTIESVLTAALPAPTTGQGRLF